MYQKMLLTLTVILCLTLGYMFSALAVEIGIEAENATTIEAPMVIGVPTDAATQGGPEPGAPSGGKFVWMPGPPATGGGDEGFMEFVANIPADGTYAIWGRVVAWDGNSDSCWVTVAPSDPDENPQETGNTEFRWAVAQGNDWHWDRINQWLNGGTFEREWTLSKGEAKIKIWTREDAAMLDCIYITDNLSDDEAEVQPKLPSEVMPAVKSHGKLTTTWANVKDIR